MASGKKLFQIEGLRALAIIFIILFHMCPETFPMGFLGVEVFLVITGYFLFAKPFRKEDETLRAASGRFVEKKLKRLMVPLAVLVLLTMVLCFFFLTPEDYRLAAITGLFSMIGASNFYLHKIASDYFSTDVSYCALTHTWYLAVIIQMYLLYLVGGLVSAKWPRKVCVGVLAVVGLASLFWFNIELIQDLVNSLGGNWHVRSKPDYYGVVGRLWEVLAGAAVPFLPEIRSRVCRTILSLTALVVLVVLSAQCFYVERTVLPMVAVLCTALLIRYSTDNATCSLLSLKPLVLVGMVSFSLYLVHFPIIVCYHCVECDNSLPGLLLVGAVIGVAGVLFYRLIEHRTFSGKQGLALAGAALALSGVGTLSPNAFLWSASDVQPTGYTKPFVRAPERYFQGFETKNMAAISHLELVSDRRHSPSSTEPLLLMGAGEGVEASFALIGDSHAASMFPGLDMFCKEHGISGLYVKTYIVPFTGWDLSSSTVFLGAPRDASLIRWLKEHPELHTVILCQYWQSRFTDKPGFHPAGADAMPKADALRRYVQTLREAGKEVIIVYSAPSIESMSVLRDYRLSSRTGDATPRFRRISCTKEEYLRDKAEAHKVLQGMEDEGLCHLLHVERSLFNEKGVFEAVQGGYRYLRDTDHLTPEGSIKAMEGCGDDLLRWLRR